MFAKFYDFIIRKHLEVLTIIFVGISLILLSQTENHVIFSLQTKWKDVSSFVEKPILEQQRKRKVIEENKQLRMDVFRLNQEISHLRSLDTENERLREMLGFRDTSKYELLPSLILYKGFKSGANIITLDKGRNDNVHKNDIIIDKDGLIGRILSSGKRSSISSMIIEPDVRVSVRINPSRVYGILKWHHGNIFVIEDIPTNIDIKPGWTVTTSGFSEIYPPDIPIGVITDVSSSENGFTYLIYGDYFVSFKTLHEVFILRNYEK
ncbi:MAG: rod shape-determining protein MreC [Candidatus Marinimicrobia bacterium]|nr:rod shape-determining protein MreC [Candidatus Neomarinimicrobiota bacterium]